MFGAISGSTQKSPGAGYCAHARAQLADAAIGIRARFLLFAKPKPPSPIHRTLDGTVCRLDCPRLQSVFLAIALGHDDGLFHPLLSNERFSVICRGSSFCGEDRPGPSEQPLEDQCRASHLGHKDGHTILDFILRPRSDESGRTIERRSVRSAGRQGFPMRPSTTGAKKMRDRCFRR